MINLILAGQLFGTAFACGLNLYVTVAILGLAVRFDWITGLPAGLGGLGNGIVIGSAIALYFTEMIVDRVPYAGTTWEAVHTLIRPAAAAALTMLALQDAPAEIQLVAVPAAAAIALAAHGSKAGLRLMVATRPRPSAGLNLALSLAEDVAAVVITAAVLLRPEAALAVAGASFALLLIAGPRLWRAASLGASAVIAQMRGFFSRPGWRAREQLPRWLRGVVPIEPLGRGPARATRAAVTGLGRIGAYRSGWLVFTCDGPRFAYRSLLRPRWTELTDISDVRLRVGLVTDALYVNTGTTDGYPLSSPLANSPAGVAGFTIFLLKDGPAPHETVAELLRNGS